MPVFRSRKPTELAAQITRLTADAQALQKACQGLDGGALARAVTAQKELARAVEGVKDALATARSLAQAEPLEGWQGHTRLPLWQLETDTPEMPELADRDRVGDGAYLFHDSPSAKIGASQIPQDEGAPFALRLDLAGYEGSFLSLALDLPAQFSAEIQPTDVVRIAVDRSSVTPVTLYLRLNLQSGPNTEQILRSLPGEAGPGWIEFDLAYVPELADRSFDKLWVDVMFDSGADNRITLHDLTVAHRRRTEM